MNFSQDILPVSTPQKQQFVLFESQAEQLTEDTFCWYVSVEFISNNISKKMMPVDVVHYTVHGFGHFHIEGLLLLFTEVGKLSTGLVGWGYGGARSLVSGGR